MIVRLYAVGAVFEIDAAKLEVPEAQLLDEVRRLILRGDGLPLVGGGRMHPHLRHVTAQFVVTAMPERGDPS